MPLEAVPEPITMAPLLPDCDEPEPINKEPLVPTLEVPVLRTNKPLVPDDPAWLWKGVSYHLIAEKHYSR